MEKRYFTFTCGFLLFFTIYFISSSLPAVAADRTIGVIMTGGTPYYREIHKAFTESLSAEGLKAEIILQTPMPDPMSWTNSARKLVAIGSDVIISYGAPATISVSKETSDIPIIFAGVYNPHAVGVSGNNITGISSKVPVASLIKTLKSISNFSTLGVVYNDAEKDTVLQANEVKQLESNFGFNSMRFNVKKKEDASKIGKIDALFLTTSCAAMHCVNNIIGIARQAKIATASTIGGGENDGIILTLTANPVEQGREAAKMAARIIKGAKPSTIPVEFPKKVDLILNIKEAADLGLKVPFDLLTSATKVIK
ncbi:MAG: ABC transporter substrate-binding protein [Nitrospirota bacterium]